MWNDWKLCLLGCKVYDWKLVCVLWVFVDLWSVGLCEWDGCEFSLFVDFVEIRFRFCVLFWYSCVCDRWFCYWWWCLVLVMCGMGLRDRYDVWYDRVCFRWFIWWRLLCRWCGCFGRCCGFGCSWCVWYRDRDVGRIGWWVEVWFRFRVVGLTRIRVIMWIGVCIMWYRFLFWLWWVSVCWWEFRVWLLCWWLCVVILVRVGWWFGVVCYRLWWVEYWMWVLCLWLVWDFCLGFGCSGDDFSEIGSNICKVVWWWRLRDDWWWDWVSGFEMWFCVWFYVLLWIGMWWDSFVLLLVVGFRWCYGWLWLFRLDCLLVWLLYNE